MLSELFIILVLVFLNRFLALSELALVSASPARLRARVEQGVPGADAALRLVEAPGAFLSTVQFGITLVGVVAGAVSGATLGTRLAERLPDLGVPPALSQELGVGLVVIAITYLAIVVGELVPKRIALADPERTACRVAPAMTVLSRIGRPAVWLLDRSSKALLTVLGYSGQRELSVSEEDLHSLISEAADAGVIEKEETELIGGVMRLADRRASGLMTPAHEVEFAEADESRETLLSRFRKSGHSRLPFRDGGPDDIIGVIHSRDLLDTTSERFDARSLLRQAQVIHDALPALEAVDQLRKSQGHMLLVYDEYGKFEGIITPMNVLGAIAGGFDEDEQDEPELVERDDGSFLVTGSMPIDELATKLELTFEEPPRYETVAGMVLDHVRGLPKTGQKIRIEDLVIEIVDMDGRRIDSILLRRDTGPIAATPSGPDS